MTGPIRRTEWPIHWPALGRRVEIPPRSNQEATDFRARWLEVSARQMERKIEDMGFTTHLDVVEARMMHEVQEWPYDPNSDDARARYMSPPGPFDRPGASHLFRFPDYMPKVGDPLRYLDGPRHGERGEVPATRDPINLHDNPLSPTHYWLVALDTATGEWLYTVDDLRYRAQNPAPKPQE